MIGAGGKVSSTISKPMLLVVPITILMTPSTSWVFKSGSTSYLIFAISYKYFTLTLAVLPYPGSGLPFNWEAAFLMNQEVGGGFITNLKLLSTYAFSLTLIGVSSLKLPDLSLNSLQNCIMFTPSGPRA